jgi:hypothetical protein
MFVDRLERGVKLKCGRWLLLGSLMKRVLPHNQVVILLFSLIVIFCWTIQCPIIITNCFISQDQWFKVAEYRLENRELMYFLNLFPEMFQFNLNEFLLFFQKKGYTLHEGDGLRSISQHIDFPINFHTTPSVIPAICLIDNLNDSNRYLFVSQSTL